MGDEWGELDTRFLYGAFNALSLLGLLHMVDVPKAVAYVHACGNLEGGYGIRPGAESHAGQVFTCVGALAIAGELDSIDKDRLGGWLSERQLAVLNWKSDATTRQAQKGDAASYVHRYGLEDENKTRMLFTEGLEKQSTLGGVS